MRPTAGNLTILQTSREAGGKKPHENHRAMLIRDHPVSSDMPSSRGSLALAIAGSNLTAIAAELVAATGTYDDVWAITPQKISTTLPVVMEGDQWARRLKQLGWFGANRSIREFEEHITSLTGGRTYDCLLHHSKDPFSQLLSSHPLCRKFYYVEEGLTALIGGPLGRSLPRRSKQLLWRLKSTLFYDGRIDKYRAFFDLRASNYGGVYALSRNAFKDYPGRIQLPTASLAASHPVPAEVVIFLDSHYFRGNCPADDYLSALTACLTAILDHRATAAIKFHPAEQDARRKDRIMQAVAALACIADLRELPADFIGERMTCTPDTKVVVGTTALGLFLAEQGAQTFTFAPRLAASSERYAHLLRQLPPEFLHHCQSA